MMLPNYYQKSKNGHCFGGPNIEILNQIAAKITQTEALKDEITHILKGLTNCIGEANIAEAFRVNASTPNSGLLQRAANPSLTRGAQRLDAIGQVAIPIPNTDQESGCLSTSLIARYNRNELYEQVWAIPMLKLAKQYGVSDVALAKTCRKLRIPVPGRGYWAKRTAGKPVTTRPPLSILRMRASEVRRTNTAAKPNRG